MAFQLNEHTPALETTAERITRYRGTAADCYRKGRSCESHSVTAQYFEIARIWAEMARQLDL
jgi:hypothetical protein